RLAGAGGLQGSGPCAAHRRGLEDEAKLVPDRGCRPRHPAGCTEADVGPRRRDGDGSQRRASRLHRPRPGDGRPDQGRCQGRREVEPAKCRGRPGCGPPLIFIRVILNSGFTRTKYPPMTQNIIAFEGTRRVAAGPLATVVAAAKPVVDRAGNGQVLLFDAETSQPVEIDFRGSLDDVLARIDPKPAATDEARGPGRPKLGVVAREVTLLPRHWEWLKEQTGGASVALRKLVDQARK